MFKSETKFASRSPMILLDDHIVGTGSQLKLDASLLLSSSI